ncbi:type II toxin-antitoxin system RelE/ParE family toxin [Thalassomonas viridans]|uniref:Type II toxin-antitoxin system RelE/ParE family toxin n=1 Tax=Thalassomonas viridans TaxID=137584 RepID=A0AAE9Z534_9GAMM|nr:type II toxin-antitoxin system RelE/ParE family toxin [Thalassomonas viridans]WDE06204.1 type II toxin-antitoxin system RelE/ParE family toxin [Thalassomonas viridans]
MVEIIWTEPALNDLNDVIEYIALQNVKAAKKLTQTIFSKIERLAFFPHSGKVPEELTMLNFKEVVVPPCRIFYRVAEDKVYILHVMRQERDLARFLLSH